MDRDRTEPEVPQPQPTTPLPYAESELAACAHRAQHASGFGESAI